MASKTLGDENTFQELVSLFPSRGQEPKTSYNLYRPYFSSQEIRPLSDLNPSCFRKTLVPPTQRLLEAAQCGGPVVTFLSLAHTSPVSLLASPLSVGSINLSSFELFPPQASCSKAADEGKRNAKSPSSHEPGLEDKPGPAGSGQQAVRFGGGGGGGSAHQPDSRGALD